MKKLLLCGAVAAGCCLPLAAQSKINNAGLVQLDTYHAARQLLEQSSPMRAAALNQNVSIFVSLNDGYSADDLRARGIEVVDQTDDMAIISLPIGDVEALAEQDLIKGVHFGYQAEPYMDQARTLSFADGVHEGTAEGLSRGYRGKGVYVGLYDTGLDPNHINFTDKDGVSRVKAVFLANNGSISPYTTPEAIANFTTDDRYETHGTHVLGTIAGRDDVPGHYAYMQGSSVKIEDGAIPYGGLAPDADILVGCGSFDNASINAGIGKVIDYAKADGRPVIVNLSLGHNRGSHDPREMVNRYLDSRAQDAIIVVSAGNEGDSQMSIEREFTRSTSIRTAIVPTSTNNKAMIFYSAEFWSNNEKPFEGELVLFNKVSKDVVASKPFSGTSGSISWNTNDSQFSAAFESGSYVNCRWGIDSETGRFNVYMQNQMTAKSGDVVFGIIISGEAGLRLNGYCDAFNGYTQSDVRFSSVTGWTGSITGTAVGSINGMACGLHTISVGAWVSRTAIPNVAGGRSTVNAGNGVGSIADFSSYGKSGDGRQLPIVVGPGAQIISSYSRYYADNANFTDNNLQARATINGKVHPWSYMQGTSMSSPFVAGTLALWLEACPDMRAKEAKQIIDETSKNDNYTAINPERWGAGKINVLEGLKKAISLSASVESVLTDKADENLLITAMGGKQYEICVPGVNNLSAALFNLQGAEVAVANGADDTLYLDASALAEGIYVVSVNAGGQKLSRKIVVK